MNRNTNKAPTIKKGALSKTLARTLQKHGEQAIQRLEGAAMSLAEELGLDPYTNVVRGPVKDMERIFEKAARYDNNLQEIPDLCRVRILFNNPSQVLLARALLKNGSAFVNNLDQKSLHFVEADDSFFEPKQHGFRGFQIIFNMDLGKNRMVKGEIQLLHENMQQTDQISHTLYEEIRSIEDRARGQDRDLNANEKAAISGYYKTNKALYDADAKNYGLYILEKGYKPKTKKPHRGRYRHTFFDYDAY